MGGVIAGLLYDNVFAANASLKRARGYLLASNYEGDTFEENREKPSKIVADEEAWQTPAKERPLLSSTLMTTIEGDTSVELQELPNEEKKAGENGTKSSPSKTKLNGSKTSLKSNGSENGEESKETTPLNPQPTWDYSI